VQDKLLELCVHLFLFKYFQYKYTKYIQIFKITINITDLRAVSNQLRQQQKIEYINNDMAVNSLYLRFTVILFLLGTC